MSPSQAASRHPSPDRPATDHPVTDHPVTDHPATDGPTTDGTAPTARLRVQRVRPAYRQVADDLRAQIMRGAVAAGERLPSEPDLALAFGVSRSTVREALRVLASQHLIETRRGVRGGSFVAAPDPARVVEDVGGALGVLVTTPHLRMEDLLEARLLLEPAAARLAAQRADTETVEAVRAAAQAPRDPDDPTGFVPHLDFHTTVLMATGNLMFTMMGQPVHDVLRTQLDRDRVARSEWDTVDECHRVIAGHIAAGEDAAAEEAMRSHLLDLRVLYRRAASWRGPARPG